MKFREIFRFELVYQLGRVWTWLVFGSLFAFSVLMTRDGTLAEALFDDFFINSPFAIAKTTITAALIWLLIGAMISGEAGARDSATGLSPLIYTAPIKKWEFLGGKFLAAFVINALIMLAVQAGILLAVYAPGIDPKLVGPFRPAAYLTAYAFLALPNIFAGTSLQFALAAKTGRPMAAYLGSIFLFFMSYILGIFLFFQGRREAANLLDPIGVHFILSDLSHLWTPTEKSWRLVSLEGTVLNNRLIWTAVAVICLLFSYKTFHFRHRVLKTFNFDWLLFRSGQKDVTPGLVSGISSHKMTARPGISTSSASRFKQLLHVAWTSFRATATSWAGLVMLIAIPALTILVVIDQMEANGVPLLPSTIRVINELTMPLSAEFSRWIIIPLLLIFFAGELVWRERDAGMAEIHDAMPGPEWILVTGKLLGIAMLLFMLMATLTTSGILAQLMLGFREIQFVLYLKILFGLQFTEYFLFSVLAVVLHIIINQKYLGHLAAIFAYVTVSLAPMFGLEHNLLIWGASAAWSYTDMQGFGDSITPWIWFKLYWASWALLLFVIGKLAWVRGRENGVRIRLRISRNRFDRTTLGVSAMAVVLVLFTGGFIFYNTNILNDYITKSDAEFRQAEYERRYAKYASIPQPEITQTELDVDIYPEERRVITKGSYQLINKSTAEIDTILISLAREVETDSIRLDRRFSLISDDKSNGQRVYLLETPLRPKDSITLGFAVQAARHGFSENGSHFPVVENGSTFSIQKWLPAIGYQSQRELITAADRRRHRLPERPLIASLYDQKAREGRHGGIHFKATISTSADQTAVAPGALLRSRIKSGRRYFEYETNGPIGNEWTIFSARYTSRTVEWKNPDSAAHAVAIRIFHDPSHTNHVDRVLRSVTNSLEYYSRNFGAYPYNHLSIVERPGNGTGMHADPSMIIHGEGFTQWNPGNDENNLDLPYAIVAHEMGHQWTVPYAPVEGAPVMSESVAWYYGMKAVEYSHGYDQLGRLLSFMREPYPYPPIRRGEPLLRGLDPYLSYRRGPFALYAVSEYIGDENVNHALHEMLKRHREPGAPLATTLDLYRGLQSATPDSLQYLLHDLFEVNTYWELETERVTSKQLNTQHWEVVLEVNARKIVADSAGVETEVVMNDWIELGALGPNEDGKGGEIIYRNKHRVRSGRQTFRFAVSSEPARAGIDPWHLLLDLRTEDNTGQVKNIE